MRRNKHIKAKPFPFLTLPAEIRVRVYELLLQVPKPIQLEASNRLRIAPLLNVLRVSRQLYDEAYRVFYAVNTFRIFSTDGRFFQTKSPLLSRLTPPYRTAITTLELRLGPGWTAPPKRWIIEPKLGLGNCNALKMLKIFVEFDPSSSHVFLEWMSGRSLYTDFSTDLVAKIYEAVPSITQVQFDGYQSVQHEGDIMVALVAQAKSAQKKVTYGPLRGWSENSVTLKVTDSDEEGMLDNTHLPLWVSV